MKDDVIARVQERHLADVVRMLSGIHRRAARLFRESWLQGGADAWIVEAGPDGVWCNISQDAFMVCYALFDAAPLPSRFWPMIETHLADVQAMRGDRPLFYNVRGDQQEMQVFLRRHGFKQDSLGYEMVCSGVRDRLSGFDDLALRSYQADYFEQYLQLLDCAFNPLIERSGGQTDAFSRQRTALQDRLEEKARKESFVSLWQGDTLIGIYERREDLIEVLAIAPAYQGKGYGTFLLQAATEQIIQRCGYSQAYLQVTVSNQSARRLYQRLGFKISGYYAEHTYVGINC